MNPIETIQKSFFNFIQKQFALSSEECSSVSFSINTDEQKQAFGDITSNAALVLAKKIHKNPLILAQEISSTFTDEAIETIQIAGAGFINITLKHSWWVLIAEQLFTTKESFFTLDHSAPKQYVSIEFVSANPTGPLHIGHGRGGIIGDVLGNIFSFLGHKVVKEFYINDAGSQIAKLGASFKIRCQQLLGVEINLPEEAYHGEYLIPLAQACVNQYGTALLQQPDSFFAQYAKEHLLTSVKKTLSDYGINFDHWFSEKTLHDSGAITASITHLAEQGATYQKDGALWFAATAFGDDKDRVLRKANGELTYIAADVAYLENKLARNFDHIIMVLGQDHHSYVVRLKGILQALKKDPAILDVILYQLVTIKATGQLLRMSKRTGNIVTLDDVIETVGKDVARFFYLNRKADAHLDFDVDLALKKTDENPVYYIQYAYVRTKSILHKAEQEPDLRTINERDTVGLGHAEQLLLKKIISLNVLLQAITKHYQTHMLAYYVLELAQLFHAYYAKNRIVDPEKITQSRARLLLITIIRNTLETCLTLLGISCPERM